MIITEDHYEVGGIGDAVADAAPARPDREVSRCADPRSGKPEELLDRFGISARHIVEAAAQSCPP